MTNAMWALVAVIVIVVAIAAYEIGRNRSARQNQWVWELRERITDLQTQGYILEYDIGRTASSRIKLMIHNQDYTAWFSYSPARRELTVKNPNVGFRGVFDLSDDYSSHGLFTRLRSMAPVFNLLPDDAFSHDATSTQAALETHEHENTPRRGFFGHRRSNATADQPTESVDDQPHAEWGPADLVQPTDDEHSDHPVPAMGYDEPEVRESGLSTERIGS